MAWWKRSCAWACGVLFWIARSRARPAFTRARSEGGSSGCRATSAIRRAASAPRSARTSAERLALSAPTATFSSPPIPASSRASASAGRAAVPSRIIRPVRSASQTSAFPSYRFPAATTRRRLTFGTWPNGTIVTARPLGRVKRAGFGSVKSLGAPAGGGACFCCAAGGAAASSRRPAAMARAEVVRVIVRLPSPARPCPARWCRPCDCRAAGTRAPSPARGPGSPSRTPPRAG